jgi:hypothetical protein
MDDEQIDLTEQIERCRRLAEFVTDEPMRHALAELAEAYEARLKRRNAEPFMLRTRVE